MNDECLDLLEKYFEENHIDPDSQDAEKIRDLCSGIWSSAYEDGKYEEYWNI